MLVSILITFLVVILVLYLINLLPIDGRAKQIARVVVIILGVISLLSGIIVTALSVASTGTQGCGSAAASASSRPM